MTMQLTKSLIAILVAASLPAWGQTPAKTTRPLSLDEAIQAALKHNLDLAIERINPEMAKYNLALAYSGYDPSFDIQGTHSSRSSPAGVNRENEVYPGTSSGSDNFSMSLSTPSGIGPTGLRYTLTSNLGETEQTTLPYGSAFGSAGISMRQPLLNGLWIDDTRRQIILSKKDLKISEQSLERAIMATITSVQVAYYDVIASREKVEVQRKALQLSQKQLEENQMKVKLGALAPLSEKQAESKVASDQAALLAAQRGFDNMQNNLKKLITDNFRDMESIELSPTDPLTTPVIQFNLQDSWQKGLSMRPDLLNSRRELEKLHITLKYDRSQLFPQLDLIGTYTLVGSKIGPGMGISSALDGISRRDSPQYSWGAELSIPLSNRRARYNYKKSKANVELYLLSLKKQEQDIMVEIDTAVKLAQTQLESVTATSKAREYAAQALEAEQKLLLNGKSTSFVVLSLQSALTAAESAEIDAKVSYNKSLANLSLSEGSTLQTQGIKVQTK